MPSKKQRRRRQKFQRHEYEYVVETDEGEEVAVERLRDAEDGRPSQAKNGARAKTALVDRRGRPIQKPSLRRVVRRTAIFAPILAIFVYFTGREDLSTAGIVLNTAILLAFFMPFSYLVDTMVYRLVLRRHEREQAERRRR